MSKTTMADALRAAAEVERGGARFYTMLAAKASTPEARKFFEKFAQDEVDHANRLEQKARELADQARVVLPEPCVKMVESAPGWGDEESVDVQQAFQIAIEAENYAALYYDTLADYAEGSVKEFFAGLARMEEEHAARIRAKRSEFFG